MAIKGLYTQPSVISHPDDLFNIALTRPLERTERANLLSTYLAMHKDHADEGFDLQYHDNLSSFPLCINGIWDTGRVASRWYVDDNYNIYRQICVVSDIIERFIELGKLYLHEDKPIDMHTVWYDNYFVRSREMSYASYVNYCNQDPLHLYGDDEINYDTVNDIVRIKVEPGRLFVEDCNALDNHFYRLLSIGECSDGRGFIGIANNLNTLANFPFVTLVEDTSDGYADVYMQYFTLSYSDTPKANYLASAAGKFYAEVKSDIEDVIDAAGDVTYDGVRPRPVGVYTAMIQGSIWHMFAHKNNKWLMYIDVPRYRKNNLKRGRGSIDGIEDKLPALVVYTHNSEVPFYDPLSFDADNIEIIQENFSLGIVSDELEGKIRDKLGLEDQDSVSKLLHIGWFFELDQPGD